MTREKFGKHNVYIGKRCFLSFFFCRALNFLNCFKYDYMGLLTYVIELCVF